MALFPELTEDQRDCLQEVCNVALGQAADHLARTFGVFVTLPIPNIAMVPADQFVTAVQSFEQGASVYGARQLFSSSDELAALNGIALTLFSESSLSDLQTMLPANVAESERVAEATRHISNACLEALHQHWEWTLQITDVEDLGVGLLSSVCDAGMVDAQQLLLVEINFRIEGRSFNSDLVLLFPGQSIEHLVERLELLLA